MCKLLNKHELTIKALIILGNSMSQMQEYEKSAIFIKRALEYAWLIGDEETELKLLD
jgi:hypothetical protein